MGISTDDLRRICVFEDASLWRCVSSCHVSKGYRVSSTVKQTLEPEVYKVLQNFRTPNLATRRQSTAASIPQQQCYDNLKCRQLSAWVPHSRLPLKCDGTCAETRFRLSSQLTIPFKSCGGISSVDYWQPSCARQPAGFVVLVRACVLQSCDAYWLPNPFASFPFTSPTVRHRVPSHFKRSLLTAHCKHFLHSWWTRPLNVPVKTSVAVGAVQNPEWCTLPMTLTLLYCSCYTVW
jgi:hypothetical protein